jgi:hypothetical protein
MLKERRSRFCRRLLQAARAWLIRIATDGNGQYALFNPSR